MKTAEIQYLIDFLRSNNPLVYSVNLIQQNLSGERLRVVFEALRSNTTVHGMYLQANDIMPREQGFSRRYSVQFYITLYQFVMEWNLWWSARGLRICSPVQHCFEHHTSARILAGALRSNVHVINLQHSNAAIKNLNLAENYIGPAGVTALAHYQPCKEQCWEWRSKNLGNCSSVKYNPVRWMNVNETLGWAWKKDQSWGCNV